MRSALEQAARGRGCATIPTGTQKTCRCGTQGHRLGGSAVLMVGLNYLGDLFQPQKFYNSVEYKMIKYS